MMRQEFEHRRWVVEADESGPHARQAAGG